MSNHVVVFMKTSSTTWTNHPHSTDSATSGCTRTATYEGAYLDVVVGLDRDHGSCTYTLRGTLLTTWPGAYTSTETSTAARTNRNSSTTTFVRTSIAIFLRVRKVAIVVDAH